MELPKHLDNSSPELAITKATREENHTIKYYTKDPILLQMRLINSSSYKKSK